MAHACNHLQQAVADTASALLTALHVSRSALHCSLQQAEAGTASLGSGAGSGQRSEAELQSQAAAVVRMAQAAAPPQLETESNTDSMRSAWQVGGPRARLHGLPAKGDGKEIT